MPFVPIGVSGSHDAAANLRLDSWKEIAAYLCRGERTVKRWERERSLPVHRLPGADVEASMLLLRNWMSG